MKISFLIILSLIIGISYAQDIKVLKATSQHWSGGVCCRYGTNYRIELETKSDKIILDTAWINGNFYPLDFSQKASLANTKKYDSLKHVFIYTIAVGESHDDAPHPVNINSPQKDTTKNNAIPKKEFTGAALITYHIKNKEFSYIIKEFTALKNLMYP